MTGVHKGRIMVSLPLSLSLSLSLLNVLSVSYCKHIRKIVGYGMREIIAQEKVEMQREVK